MEGRVVGGLTKKRERTCLKIISFPQEPDKSQYLCMAQVLNQEV